MGDRIGCAFRGLCWQSRNGQVLWDHSRFRELAFGCAALRSWASLFILHAGKVGTVFRHSWISAPCAPAHGDLWHSLAMSVGWKGSSIQPFLKDAGSEKGLWGWGGGWGGALF